MTIGTHLNVRRECSRHSMSRWIVPLAAGMLVVACSPSGGATTAGTPTPTTHTTTQQSAAPVTSAPPSNDPPTVAPTTIVASNSAPTTAADFGKYPPREPDKLKPLVGTTLPTTFRGLPEREGSVRGVLIDKVSYGSPVDVMASLVKQSDAYGLLADRLRGATYVGRALCGRQPEVEADSCIMAGSDGSLFVLTVVETVPLERLAAATAEFYDSL